MKISALKSADNPAPSFLGPKDFHWLVPGRLGGAPRPGIGFGHDVQSDMDALRRVNTRLLVNLTEECDPSRHLVEAAGLESYHHRIPDMGAPSLLDAMNTCRLVDQYLSDGKVCVYHCHAGKGRTGTMLAAQIIYYGIDADAAIATARERNAKWIESQQQFDFLYLFFEYVSQHAAGRR